MKNQETLAVSAENTEDDMLNSGAATEVSVSHPFEGFFYLKKEWVDQEDGIEKVSFNMTIGHLNLPADWNNTQSFIMMPEWGSSPLRRTWIVRLPTHFEDQDRYLFHYFFQITYTDGSERISTAFSQLVNPREFDYIDHSGELVHVRLHWSIGNWSYPQTTEMEVDGIDWGSEFSVSHAPYRTNDRLYHNGRILVMQRIPVPRRFRTVVWAPKGSEISYCFQLIRSVGDTLASLWDSNSGKDYRLTI